MTGQLRCRDHPPHHSSLALGPRHEASRPSPSMLVREMATRQLEERRADWGYSKLMLALDIMWNVAFVVVSALGESMLGAAVQSLLPQSKATR
ncbi:hypothetical protein CMV_030179 [Castanea mollissima]|uniref:Uncharacterized protein n=1 Tax=Castanea mollissima TaxID=60419 RepID=A0A8J4UYQ1_9ROSI|nr:hypothetical protein CMV_030179 [Castanea mollissima]